MTNLVEHGNRRSRAISFVCILSLIAVSLPVCMLGTRLLFAAAPLEPVKQAEALFRAGKWDESRRIYERLLPTLTGNDKAQALLNVGLCWQRIHKHTEALPYFQGALDMEGIEARHEASAKMRLGYSLRLLQRNAEAVVVLEQAAAVEGAEPNQVAEALLYAAWGYNTLKQTDDARKTFERVVEVEGVHSNYVATAYLSIGRLLQDRKQYEQAIDVYRKIDSLNPVASVNRARANVYILECEALLAGDNQFHIRPYVSKVSSTSAKVFWVSQGKAPAGTVTLSGNDQSHDAEPAVTPLPETICELHTASFDGLKPHTVYHYRVGCGDQEAEGSFKTAPESAAAFRFCVIGDTQSYHKGLQPLLEAMADEQADFILHVGDLTDRGDMWGEWKASFFDPGWNYFRQSAFWPAYGNHDGGPYFGRLFDLQPHYYQSFDYGHAHVILLDSYGGGAGGTGRQKQLEWLKADLEQNTKPWTFVALHVPMVATSRDLDWFGKDDFLPLLEEHGVDIVFSGHHPHYRRYRPIGRDGQKPVLHITSGGGGGPIGGNMPSPVLSSGIDVNHYCVVDVDANRLTLSARAANGAVIDRFELVKSGNEFQPEVMQAAVATGQAEKIVSLYQELITDRTYELHLWTRSQPAAAEEATLILDIDRLPRGPLKADAFPEGSELIVSSTDASAWQIPEQTLSLSNRTASFRAIPLKPVAADKTSITPHAQVMLRLKVGDRLYEPLTATARLRVLEAE